MSKIIRKIYNASETKAVEDSNRTLIVRISTVGEDRSGDIVIPKGAVLDNYLKNAVVAQFHDYSKPAIARAVELEVNDSDILAKIEFPPEGDYEQADILYRLYKGGFMNAWSIGFIPKEYDNSPSGGYMYTKWELLEFSAVLVPDNPEALTLAKSNGINIKAVEKGVLKTEEMIKKLEEQNNTEETLEVPEEQEEKPKEIKIMEKKDVGEVVSLADVISYLDLISYWFKENGVKEEVITMLNQAMEILMNALKEEATIGQKGVLIIEKEGKVLSEKNKALVNDVLSKMEDASAAMKQLLEATEPKEKAVGEEVKVLQGQIQAYKLIDQMVGKRLRDLKLQQSGAGHSTQ